MHLFHRHQYSILGFLIGGLFDSLVDSNETLVPIVGSLAAFLAGFLLWRKRNEH
jgi:LPXTG-motif cell wall-anchored protein